MATTSQAVQDSGPSEDAILDALDRTIDVMARSATPYVVIGEIGSAVWGRDRGTKDIDLFVRPGSLSRVLEAFEEAGFHTFVKFEHWLYKAALGEVEVDILFRASPDILLDDEMLERSTLAEFRGRTLPIAPPEDLVVMKAVAAGEDTARYWYDALGILSRSTLDWTYFIERARQSGARRILSLLIFAISNDLIVPDEPIRQLMRTVGLSEEESDGG